MALGKFGKYERVDVLGHGASGIVYLAWDTLLKKQIALKEIDLQAGDIERFLEEARVIDRLRHPNIVRVNGVETLDGHVLIDMEYVKGSNLQQILRKEGRLAPARCIHIAAQTLDALEYAHQNHTVHRDIKPANILLGSNDMVKLVDFGLAEILATNSYAGGAGTYAYMAPEDFAEERRSDHQSDIWAVGVSLFEMLTASRPFVVINPKDPFAWRRVLLNDDPLPLSNFLDGPITELQAALNKSLARDKSMRFQSAGEFRAALLAIDPSELVSPANMNALEVEQSPVWDEELPANTRPFQFQFESPLMGSRATAVLEGPPIININPVPVTASSLAADSNPVQVVPETRRGIRFPFLQKEIVPWSASISQVSVVFGEVRKGDERKQILRLNFEGGKGLPSARIISAPTWLEVFPLEISKRRQKLTMIAHTEQVWETGHLEEFVRIESSAGPISIPVVIDVLKARPTFYQVALWYLPLMLAVLLPCAVIVYGAIGAGSHYLAPVAALGSCLLAAMVLLVTIEADLGMGERLASGILLALMSMVFGVSYGYVSQYGRSSGLSALPATGVPLGILLFVQIFTRKRWKLWAGAIFVLGLITAGTLLQVTK